MNKHAIFLYITVMNLQPSALWRLFLTQGNTNMRLTFGILMSLVAEALEQKYNEFRAAYYTETTIKL